MTDQELDDALTWAEDFRAAWAGLDAKDFARLRTAMRAAEDQGHAAGGLRCCGTTGAWHRPWCYTGPVQHRPPSPMAGQLPLPGTGMSWVAPG